MTDRNGRRAVYLVRHGSTPCNEEGRICGSLEVTLSETGRSQAELAAAALGRLRVDLVLSSPFERTLETARIVARAHGLEPEPEAGLGELALGSWTGRSRAELAGEPSWRRWLEEPAEAETPEGERLEVVQGRALAALRRGVERTPEGGGLVVVSHGGVLRVVLLGLLGLPLASYHRLRVDTGSVSGLRLDREGRLLALLGLNLGEPARVLRP